MEWNDDKYTRNELRVIQAERDQCIRIVMRAWERFPDNPLVQAVLRSVAEEIKEASLQ